MCGITEAPVKLPDNWKAVAPGDNVLLVDLHSTSAEYQDVEANIRQTSARSIRIIVKASFWSSLLLFI